MGQVKKHQIEVWERGWDSLDGPVCAECVAETCLRQFITNNGAHGRCFYCSREGTVVSGDDLMSEIADGIHFEWTDPDSALIPYDGREGGYAVDISTPIEDILWEAGCNFASDDLAAAVAQSFTDHAWVSRFAMADSPEEWLFGSWKLFCDYVLHHSRYLFLSNQEKGELAWGIPPQRMLNALGETLVALEATATLPEGSRLWRAREFDPGSAPVTGAQLGTAPKHKAQFSNRMSPAGIPMFYGAYDRSTAIIEARSAISAADRPGTAVTSGAFLSRRELRVVDLSSPIEVPSLFNSKRRHLRGAARFLNQFADAVAQPITNDATERIEYVPTQIVTEYVRRVLPSQLGEPFDGVAYRSVQDPTGVCVVLFVPNEECGTLGDTSVDDQPTLELDPSTVWVQTSSG